MTRPCLIALCAIGLMCCARSEALPSPPASPRPSPLAFPHVFLGGQSNAVFVEPYLSRPFAPVITVAAPSLPIDAWRSPDGPMWAATDSQLRKAPVEAIVWWQGESDWQTPGYLAVLRDLIARMRQSAGNPRARVVIVRVLNKRTFQSVRRAQEEFVRTDANAALVSTDGLGLGGSDHLTHAGYTIVADRIRSAVGRRPGS
jgi:hypothetical protein